MFRSYPFLSFLSFSIIIALLSFTGERSNERASQILQGLKQDTALKHASWSILAMDITTGDTILSHDPHRSLVPASTQKLFTTASAFLELDTTHRFHTSILHSGSIKGHTLDGDLIIKGGGDPTLGSRYFTDSKRPGKRTLSKWAERIHEAGIDTIKGSIIGDGSYFKDDHLLPRSWIWEDIGNYYAAAPNGLCFRDNAFKVHFRSPNEVNAATRITGTTPSIPGLELENHVKTADNNEDNAYIFGAPYSYRYFIKGTIPSGREKFTIKGALPDPPFLIAHAFRKTLQKKGIHIKGKASTYRELRYKGETIDTMDLSSLFQHKSPSLNKIVKVTNRKSVNLFAEHLLLEQAIKKGTPGTGTQHAAETMRRSWDDRGISVKGMRLLDGSGLSPQNRVTTGQLVDLLAFMENSPKKAAFRSSLPVAGRSGSLKYMFNGTPAEGKLMAKSGYMEDVMAYAGYIPRPDNDHTIAFAFVINGHTCSVHTMRDKFEQLMLALMRA